MKEAEVRNRAEPGKKGEVLEKNSDFYLDILIPQYPALFHWQ